MNKKRIGYVGYAFCAILLIIILVTDLPKTTDIGLSILFTCVFSVSHVLIWHYKMLSNDKGYKREVCDERNIAIKEKAGSISNIITTVLLGIATVFLIIMNYIVPAVITGVIVILQPIILIAVSSWVEKQI